jgi:hypothetical protein
MTFKPNKSKKTSQNSHQLDLVETISVEDKLRNKRRFLYLALAATIGLSLLFWTYHYLTEVLRSPRQLLPKISIPAIRTNPKTPDANLNQTIDDNITRIIDFDPGRWNVFIHIMPDGLSYYNWSKNTTKLSEQEINTTIEKLSTLKVNKDSKIGPSLPQGLEIREIYSEDSSHSRIQALVSIPQKQIYFDIGVEGGDQNKAGDLMSQLVSTLYWSIVQSTPSAN